MGSTHRPGFAFFKTFSRFLLITFFLLSMTGCKSCRHGSDGNNTPSDGAGSNTVDTTYAWYTGEWDACTLSCGGGIQQRIVYCMDQDGNVVDDALCPETEPESRKDCNTQACPPVYSWYEDICTECALFDGQCLKTCQVYCRSDEGDRVDDSFCPGDKPAAERPCEGDACAGAAGEAYRWATFPFGDCSETCGGGVQYRSVVCVDGSGQFVKESLCDPGTKPVAEQSCNLFPCNTCDGRITEQPAAWPASDWQTASIETHGFPADAFDDLDDDLAADLPFVTSLMVVRDGYILHETYQTPANDIVAFSNDTDYFIWKTPDKNFQRISWVDESAAPVTFRMHIPAGDIATATGMPAIPGSDFTMTRVEGGASGGIEIAGTWTGSGAAFGISCFDLSLTPLPFFLTIRDTRLFHNCGTPLIDADTRHSLFSATKSVSGLTYGAAWQNGLIDSSALSTTVNDAFSGLIVDFAADDPRRDISLLDVLQMRSGLEWNEKKDLVSLKNPVFNPNPVCSPDETVTLCSILRMPSAYPPGMVWNYSEIDSYLVGAFFYYLTSQSLRDYAAQNIFSLIGITFDTADWLNIPMIPTNTEFTHGGAGLFLKTRDMARLGMLTLYDGCWDGRQVLAYDWLQLTQVPIGQGLALTELDANLDFLPPQVRDIQYGLHWWLTTGPFFGGAPVVNARGMGGQFIYVFKDMEMVIVVTSDVLGAPAGTDVDNQSNSIWDFLQINIMNKMLDGTMVDVIEVAGDWTGTNPTLCSSPFSLAITNDQLSFTCNGTVQTGNIVRCRNTENYFVWHMPDGSFIRFSWVDETLTPARFYIHVPAGDLSTAVETPPFVTVDLTKII